MNKTSLITIIVVCFVIIKSIFIEPNDIVTTTYKIQDRTLSGTRVVFLSDLHFAKNDYKRINKIVSRTIAAQPDIIILGGDYVAQNRRVNLNLFAQKLKSLQKPIYAVLGETDWKTSGEAIKNSLMVNGVRVLENSNSRLIVKGKYMDIVGISDISHYPDIETSFRRTQLPRIAVTHNPDIYFNIMDEASLILSGHTHGGQFVLPFTPPLIVPSKFGSEFASGLIKKTQNKLIISKGIGTRGFPARLNCKPEIVLVIFE